MRTQHILTAEDAAIMIAASKAEAMLKGESVSDSAILADIAPCFVERDAKKTDVIVLACTHYPLLLDAFRRSPELDVDAATEAMWPVWRALVFDRGA